MFGRVDEMLNYVTGCYDSLQFNLFDTLQAKMENYDVAATRVDQDFRGRRWLAMLIVLQVCIPMRLQFSSCLALPPFICAHFYEDAPVLG